MQIGERYGRWEIISGPDKTVSTRPKWLCRCDCGTERWVQAAQLKMGRSQSCGCWIKERHTLHGDTVGGRPTKLHDCWSHMLDRCYNPNSLRYQRYGGRGIKVCREWLNYPGFKRWALQSGYEDDLTIERIDNNKGYNPENCTWITKKEQLRNTSRSRMLTAWGETKAMAAWMDDPRCKVRRYGTLQVRIWRKWPPERAIGLEEKAISQGRG